MKKFWKALGIAMAYFMVFMGIQFLTSLGGSLILLGSLVHREGMAVFENVESFHQVFMGALVENMTLIVLISNLLTLAGFWAFFTFRHKSFFKGIGLHKTSMRNLSMSLIYGTGVCFLVELLTAYLPVSESVMEQFRTQHSMLWFGDAGLTFLSVAIVGPISEEVCFRGLCYNRLKEGMAPWAAGVLSSVLFGLAHGDPVWFLVGFVAGAALSWIYEVTGTLLCPILVHVTNNAISSLTSYSPMPEGLEKVLLFSSVPLVLLSAAAIHRWNHTPVEEESL